MKRYLHDMLNLALAVVVVWWSIAVASQFVEQASPSRSREDAPSVRSGPAASHGEGKSEFESPQATNIAMAANTPREGRKGEMSCQSKKTMPAVQINPSATAPAKAAIAKSSSLVASAETAAMVTTATVADGHSSAGTPDPPAPSFACCDLSSHGHLQTRGGDEEKAVQLNDEYKEEKCPATFLNPADAITATTSGHVRVRSSLRRIAASARRVSGERITTGAVSSSPTSTSLKASGDATSNQPPPSPGCRPTSVDPQQWPPHRFDCEPRQHATVGEELNAIEEKARQVREREALRKTSDGSMSAKTSLTAHAQPSAATAPRSLVAAKVPAMIAATATTSGAPTSDACFVDCYDPYAYVSRGDAAQQTQDVLNAIACRLWPDCLFAAFGPPPPPPPPSDSGAPYGVLFDLPTKTDAVLKLPPFGFVAGDKVLTKFLPELGKIQWQVIRAGSAVPSGWAVSVIAP